MGGILSKCRSLLSKRGAASSKSAPQKPVSIDQKDTVSLRNNEDEMRLTASNSLSEAEAKASMTQYATQSVSEGSQPPAVFNPPWSTAVSEDLWATRGWTLQEFLAASRVKCFTGDWRPVDDAGGTPKFDAYREQRTSSLVYSDLVNTTGSVDWLEYNPGVDQAIEILQAMCTRKTTKPEDMVYSVLSSLNLDIPVKYGEGFDSAFYRLQVQILSKVTDRGLLSWEEGTPSPYNSMLAGCFTAWGHTNCEDVYSEYPDFDPTISFDSNGVMRIMGPNSSQVPTIGLKELEYGETLPEKAPQWVYIQ
ncbi:hypothetical protein AB1N83_002505 [Pleurotus pulmonarius]